MSFTLRCMANQLAGVLSAAATVTDHGLKVPILKSIRVEVANGQAEFIASNSDQAVRRSIAADGSGLIHLDTAALTAKVRALRPGKPVAIEGTEKAITITQGRTRWKMQSIINDGLFDFVAAAARIEGDAFEVPAALLLAGLRAVSPALAGNERFHMSGACFDFKDGELRLVASDGALLHAVQIPGEWPHREDLLMPPEAMSAANKVFAESDVLQMIATDRGFTLDDGETLLRSKAIEATFPNWRRILLKNPAGSAVIDAAEMIAAIERVSAIREDEGKSGRFVPIRMRVAENEIELTTKNRDGEEGYDYCEAERDGEEYIVNVAGTTILTALRSFGPADSVRMEWQAVPAGQEPLPLVLRREASPTDDFRLLSVLRG